jgi:hypothetical protein
LLGVAVFVAVSCDQGTDDVSPAIASDSIPVTTSGAAPTATVPDVTGMDRAAARRLLLEAGLGVEIAVEFTDDVPAGEVVRQAPAPNVVVNKGDVVRLYVAHPLPAIPRVVGKSLAQARRILKHAGFGVGDVRKQASSEPKGTVISQTPSAGSRANPGRRVNLVVAEAGGGGGSTNCTPGYSPCLPPASDYDCAGGSGDGPKYTGLVRVTGSDPYDLDSDNDGYGCE